MSTKTWIWIGLFAGSTAGSYVPALWGAGFLSFSSVISTAVGGIIGIWLGFKLGNSFN